MEGRRKSKTVGKFPEERRRMMQRKKGGQTLRRTWSMTAVCIEGMSAWVNLPSDIERAVGSVTERGSACISVMRE